ncbi:MAG TPA: PTS transporter subunit EIIC [Dermatophilaceae bacterium]|jgi:PTS system cellobiose-specific IIC component
MKLVVDWVSTRFAPRMNALTRNAWVSAIQESILRVVPFILVGSFVTLLAIIPGLSDAVPTIWKLSDFTFGMISLFMAVLIPYFILEKKRHPEFSQIAALASVALYIMLLKPATLDNGAVSFTFARFGAQGMLVAITGGLFVGAVMNAFARWDIFKNNTTLPGFVTTWFQSLLPILIVIATGWLLTFVLEFDSFAAIVAVFSPLLTGGQSFIGFVLVCFISAFFYSFGISSWALAPVFYPIWLAGIQQNSQLVAAGRQAVNINTYEVVFSGFIAFGGIGATLMLVVMMSFMARSTRLKAIGRAGAVPSLFNINEPIVFGAPIAFNPILMVPFWLNSIVLSSLTYIALRTGLAQIPSRVFSLWYMPFPISTYLVSGLAGVGLALVLMAVSFAIWFPFFRVYDAQEVRVEQEDLAAEQGGVTAVSPVSPKARAR